MATAGPLLAGSYSQNFDSFANGIKNLGDGSFVGSNNGPASVQGQRLRLTQNTIGSTSALYRLPDLDSGLEAGGFDVQFDLALVSGNPADGLSLSFGALPLTDTTGPGEEGYQLPGGMVISFDTYINGPAETTRTLDVRIDGNQLVTVNESAFGNYQLNNTTVHVTVHWDASGLDVLFGSFTVCNNLAVPGLVPASGDRFAWSARTGGATEDVFLDNVVITTTPLSPIIRPNVALSEMVVDNTDLEDEFCQKPGWVELYNGTAAPVSLSGWSLTDNAGVPGKWAFPAAQTIPSYGYLVVYLGHGTPAPIAPDTRLHANFTLAKTGGYLGLFQGATEIDSFTYPQQYEDISYGHLGHPWTLGFLEAPSPGGKNTGLQEAGGPVPEDVVWSRVGGLITAPISVTLGISVPPAGTPPTPGAEIRYTLDNTAPTPTSTLYTGTPIAVSTSTNIRARVFAPARLPGPVASRTFLKLDSSITNYGGTGQPFNSNLPIIVIDSFGRSLDAEYSATPGARPFRYTYNVVVDRDPANGNRAILRETRQGNASDNDPDDGGPLLAPVRAPIDFQGRSGMHVRGESSSGMPQRQYAWETQDSEGNDKSVSILGFPADSDWILYAPSTDKTLLRNYIAYSSMFDTRGESSAMRTKFVEVFFNQPSHWHPTNNPAGGSNVADTSSNEITMRDYRGVYVLVEKIKRGNGRVDIAKLDPCDTAPALISGGYVFKKDKVSLDPDLQTTNQNMQVVEPLVTPGDAQWTWLRNHLNAFEAALYGLNFADPVLGYRAYIDEQSFMDNQWWVETYKQIDGYRLSTYFHKDRGQKIKASPLWDYNLSGGNADYLAGWNYRGWYYNAGISQSGVNNDYQYYGRLRQDPGYVLRHWDRYWQLRKSTFATANLIGRIDTAIAEVSDSQTAANMKNSLNWDITNYASGANTPQLWPNSTPSVEVPAARHVARWQRLGIYDWPNAAGRDQRDNYISATDTTDFNTLSTAGYNVDAPPAMSETVHFKSFMKLRLAWMDDAYILSNVILRPPLFSQEGGNVTAPYSLTISPFIGTAPSNALYTPEATAALRYGAGTIFYTLDGTDPTGDTSGVVRNWVTDSNACAATVPVPPVAPSTSSAADTDSTGKNWKDPDFNPLSPPAGVTWYSGLNGVGYDDIRTAPAVNFMPEINLAWSTPLPNGYPVADRPTMRGVNATSYITLPFTLSAGDFAGVNKLKLYAKYDDGFIAYLNGVQIASKNAPAAPVWNSGASTSANDPNAILYENIPVSNNAAAIAALRVGTNVLAVQGLNAGAASSDFLQRFKLDGEIGSAQTYSGPITINSPATVKARLLDTVTNRWSPLTEATFVVNTVPASAANLVVSEIMYNPTEPTAPEIAAGFNNDNMFEYLEVMNIGPNTIDLSGVSVTTGFDFTWPTSSPNLRLLAPGERAVMVGHAAAFAMRYAPGPGVKNVGVFNGNLGNGGEHLVISGTGGIIKDFTYDDDAPWPLEADGDGYSLVLNAPASNPDHNLPGSWGPSFGPGGSPGAGPGALDALADSDGDGMSDLLEYFTGSNRTDGASQNWPTTGMISLTVPPATTPSDYLTFAYTRSQGTNGFTIAPEVSTALTGWQPLSTLFTMVSETNNPDGTVTILWRSTGPASTLPRRLFLHVRVSTNP